MRVKEHEINALLVAGGPEHVARMRTMLGKAKALRFNVSSAKTLASASVRLAAGGVDVVLLDQSLWSPEGLKSVDTIKAKAPHVPIIVLSSTNNEDLAVKAVHEGAQDYLVLDDLDPPLLARAIRYAIERKRSEVALWQAEEKYRSIFENTVEGIFQTTPEGRYRSANPALARIYGYDSPEDLISNLTDIGGELYVEPGRRAEFIRLMQEHEVVTKFESQIYRKDRRIIWISENVRAVRDKQGRLLYYEGTVEDITESKQAEERLRHSETLYHSLVENLPQFILRKDLHERFTFANQRFCRILGRPLEEIVGKTDFDFFPPDLAAKYQQDDRLVLETGKTFEAVEEHQPPEGGKIYVNVVKTPLYDSQGNIIGLQGIFWDITERKLAEERVKRAHAELARSREELRLKNEQMEEDLVMAREIQQAILPQQYPSFPPGVPPEKSLLRFCHRYFPSGAVGGDFFNILALSENKAGVFICDVMGHGVRSALVTAILRALVEELTPLAKDPGQLLGQMNRDMRAILRQTGNSVFTTAFYLVADLEKQQLHYANAGHPKPLLVHRENGAVDVLSALDNRSRPALGLMDCAVYPTTTVQLRQDDLVLLFTDGLYDIEGPTSLLFGPDWLLAEVKKRTALSAPQLLDGLLEQIRLSSDQSAFADDVCVVGMEVASAH